MTDSRDLYKGAREKINPVDLALFIVVTVISAAGTYALIGGESVSQNPTVQINQELNSSHDSMNIDFFNETLEISMEQGSSTSFYLDLQADGNADMQLSNLTRDGTIRSSKQILDYPSGVYLLHYRYNIGPDEKHWLNMEKIEKLD